ncbi:MAG: hypothetical protein JSR82_07855 [Verrucomicrobia bacterium]|nr:hypothetical protein [Verrucomicrobiota bacterium]
MKVFSALLVIAALIVTVLIAVGRNDIMGKQFKVSDHESVYYAGQATEEEAKRAAEALKAEQYFGGSSNKDVIIRRDENGPAISFVVGGNWTDEKIQEALRGLGGRVADKALARPVTVRLIDPKLNTLKEFKVP